MPELHTDRIYQLLESRLPAGDRLAMSDVFAAALPPAVRAWLVAAVADRLAADLEAAPHLSRTAGTPAARRIGRGVVATLVPQYIVDRADLLHLLRDAVEFVEAFLHRPRRALEELLLGNAESVPVALLPSRLAIITDYTYLGIVLSRLLGERTAAGRDELRSLIARVDNEVISRHAPEELAQLMAPLFHWYALTGMQGIPVEAVLEFLDDKEMAALRDYIGGIAQIRAQSTLEAAEISSLAADHARGGLLPGAEVIPGTLPGGLEACEPTHIQPGNVREDLEASPAPEPEATPPGTVRLPEPRVEETPSGLNGAVPLEDVDDRKPAATPAELFGIQEPGGTPSPGVLENEGQAEAEGVIESPKEDVVSTPRIPEPQKPALPAAILDVSPEELPGPPALEPERSTAVQSRRSEGEQPAMRLPPEPEGTPGEPAPAQTPAQERAVRQESYKGTIRRNFALALTSAGLKVNLPTAAPRPPLAAEFSEEQRRLLIASLFRNEAGYFDNVVQTLAGLRTWRDGARYLTDFLEINRLNPYAKDVLQFTEVVRRWFVGDEEGP